MIPPSCFLVSFFGCSVMLRFAITGAGSSTARIGSASDVVGRFPRRICIFHDRLRWRPISGESGIRSNVWLHQPIKNEEKGRVGSKANSGSPEVRFRGRRLGRHDGLTAIVPCGKVRSCTICCHSLRHDSGSRCHGVRFPCKKFYRPLPLDLCSAFRCAAYAGTSIRCRRWP